MKILASFNVIASRVLAIIITSFLTTQVIIAQDWYDSGWQYRSSVTVTNPTGSALADYQVQIILNSGNFDFTRANPDGSDIRVTDNDGTTLIPYWIESTWHTTGDTLWVKVPVLPEGGTTLYVYYGNASPTVPVTDPVETPPAGPFTKNPVKIIPINVPAGRTSLLAENMVWDDVTEQYWMVLTDQTSGATVCLIKSTDPTNPNAWYWHDVAVPQAIAPHIIKHDNMWYIFYGDRAHGGPPYPIAVASSPDIGGPYTYIGPVLNAGAPGTWEDYRVDEPCVFQRSTDGKWIMLYMADSGGNVEQVGYATADNILGPYEKYAGNPCIAFGPAGSYDAGTVADPWIYEFGGVWYIGYTVSPTTASPWQTALATTTDWTTFIKHGVILPLGGEYYSFRGAVTRIDDQYVFSYTGGASAGAYRLSLATQPVYQSPLSPIDNGDAVFNFFDGFDEGSNVNTAKWTYGSGLSSQTSVSGGFLTMTAGTSYVRLNANAGFSQGYLGETRGRHPSAGTYNRTIEAGFAATGGFTNILRIWDYQINATPFYWERQAAASPGSADVNRNMAQLSDAASHTFRVYIQNDGSGGFQIDDNPVESVTAEFVPDVTISPFLMSYGNPNQFVVDWTRVRKWAGADAVTTVGTIQGRSQWTGAVSTDWSSPANWFSGTVPGTTDDVVIDVSGQYPIITGSVTCASVTVSPGACLTLGSGSVLNSPVTINTSGVDNSGSLVNLGVINGQVTYNRFFRPEDQLGDRHFFASPVGNQDAGAFISGNNTKVYQVWTYLEPSGTWNLLSSGNFRPGRGYNVDQIAGSDGLLTFKGISINSASIAATSPYATGYTNRSTPEAYHELASWTTGRSWENYGGGGWNLLGNPFASAMDAGAFITTNNGKFDPHYQALYVYDGTADVYRYAAATVPGYPAGPGPFGNYVQAGQGFYVLALYNNISFSFTAGMQVHQNDLVMMKSAGNEDPWPGLVLKASHASGETATTIIYNGVMSTGVDPGYDVGLLSTGADPEVYTTLVQKENNINFARQALPLVDCDKSHVPLGIDSKEGGEITFSASAVPIGNSKFWLEDRLTGIFTDLTTKSYTVTLPPKTFGTGRFFIIASANEPTAIDLPENDDSDIRIWNTGNSVIIKGGLNDGAFCEIYDLHGREIIELQLTDNQLNIIDLPHGIKGIILVRVTDGLKVTLRKLTVI